MNERDLNLRSSFVYVGNKRRKAALFLVLTFVLFLLSGCGGVKPQDPVDEAKINESPANAARVYVEAVFTGNYLLMFNCYPQEFVAQLSEDDLAKMEVWSEDISDSLALSKSEFVGTKASGAKDYVSDKASDLFENTLMDISEKEFIDASRIASIQKCEVDLFFELDGASKFQTVSVIVFQAGQNWYVYEMESINV